MSVPVILAAVYGGLYGLECVLAAFGSKGIPARVVQVIKDLLSDEPEINAVVEDPSLGTVIEKGPAIISDVEKVVDDAKAP